MHVRAIQIMASFPLRIYRREVKSTLTITMRDRLIDRHPIPSAYSTMQQHPMPCDDASERGSAARDFCARDEDPKAVGSEPRAHLKPSHADTQIPSSLQANNVADDSQHAGVVAMGGGGEDEVVVGRDGELVAGAGWARRAREVDDVDVEGESGTEDVDDGGAEKERKQMEKSKQGQSGEEHDREGRLEKKRNVEEDSGCESDGEDASARAAKRMRR